MVNGCLLYVKHRRIIGARRKGPKPAAPPNEQPLSSAAEEETDTGVLSAPNEAEPRPGLDNNPADRTQPYAHIQPFQEKMDTSVE
ncbi:hypothetical protein FRC17_000187 [Serendipita sp. 399]|nr:hypothetical protein FRC17_000187 [Serendipita sp. 399]